MINWFNMPDGGLSNGGQFEIKELTATENKIYEKDGEVYSKVTVNVEGGGGSSDFSTAEVTIVNNTTGEVARDLLMPIILEEEDILLIVNGLPSGIVTVPLYKGVLSTAYVGEPDDVTVSGNAEYDYGDITITGNCTITVTSAS